MFICVHSIMQVYKIQVMYICKMCNIIYKYGVSLWVIVLLYFHIDNRSFKYRYYTRVYYLDLQLYCFLAENCNIRLLDRFGVISSSKREKNNTKYDHDFENKCFHIIISNLSCCAVREGWRGQSPPSYLKQDYVSSLI